ncbi:unnamed protein product [Clonostachys rosea]|uniref:Transcription factor domain-containing protein n=1 Tax=Bionectria ochroleuca TaxID=29856 RepID=A0ABY6UWR9_BIOOC|nr:unnamed protein product [Clonostachys rosea]
MGASSHVTLFSRISQENDKLYEPYSCGEQDDELPASGSPQLGYEAKIEVVKVAEGLKQLLSAFPAEPLCQLVTFWRATGANLALGEPLVDNCRRALSDLCSLSSGEGPLGPYVTYARSLLHNSIQPLAVSVEMDLDRFCSQFLDENTRLETVGLLFCAVIRAASEVRIFPPLYMESHRRLELVSLAAKLTNTIVEAILSIDMLNDLQLVMQYENFISHSFVFGVQSYHSFRKLGDVITSVMSLGYHETFGSSKEVPTFLINIRRVAFCRAYSADKNWAIFLGRPPRLPQKYCNLPAAICAPSLSNNEKNGLALLADQDVPQWEPDTGMSTWAETRWASICASLKEEILELFRDGRKSDCDARVSHLRRRTDEYWASLPGNFRLQESLGNHKEGPWERDFLASARLNYLHVHFLVHLLCQGSSTEPSIEFVNLSREILVLVTEVIVLRHELVCSTGTSFEWKLAHYGLPAIGILLMAMLGNRSHPEITKDVEIIRSLGIIVVGVDLGTIVHPTEPNYALLSSARKTIQKVIVGIQSRESQGLPLTDLENPEPGDHIETAFVQNQLEPWDFEFSFWENLAEHPAI